MKPIFLPLLLLAANAAAIDTDYAKHYAELRRVRAAYEEVFATCAPLEKRVTIAPAYGDKEKAQRELTISRSEWTGGCAGSVIDGEGTITIHAKTSDGKAQYSVPLRWQGRGLVIKGKKVGPWDIHASERLSFMDKNLVEPDWDVGLSIWEDTVYPGHYRREANGNFTRVSYGYPPDEKRTASSKIGIHPLPDVPVITAEHAALQKQARLGKATMSLPKLAVPMLADLMPGGLVSYAPEGPLRDTRSKSAVLLLSQGTNAAFRNVDDMRAKLQAFGEREQDPTLRKLFLEVAAVPNRQVLIRDVATMLRRHFKSVGFVPDLRAFLASDAEYAYVLDVQFEHQAEQLIRAYNSALRNEGTEGSGPGDLLRGGASYVVLNRQLQVRSSYFRAGNAMPGIYVPGSRADLLNSLPSNITVLQSVFGQPSRPENGSLVTIVNWGLLLSDD